MKEAHATATQSFTVDDTVGVYAPEHLTFLADGPAVFEGLSALVTAALAGATCDVFVLPLTLDPTFDAFWMAAPGIGSDIPLDTAGAVITAMIPAWRAIQLRVKSGGTAGTVILQAMAW